MLSQQLEMNQIDLDGEVEMPIIVMKNVLDALITISDDHGLANQIRLLPDWGRNLREIKTPLSLVNDVLDTMTASDNFHLFSQIFKALPDWAREKIYKLSVSMVLDMMGGQS